MIGSAKGVHGETVCLGVPSESARKLVRRGSWRLMISPRLCFRASTSRLPVRLYRRRYPEVGLSRLELLVEPDAFLIERQRVRPGQGRPRHPARWRRLWRDGPAFAQHHLEKPPPLTRKWLPLSGRPHTGRASRHSPCPPCGRVMAPREVKPHQGMPQANRRHHFCPDRCRYFPQAAPLLLDTSAAETRRRAPQLWP